MFLQSIFKRRWVQVAVVLVGLLMTACTSSSPSSNNPTGTPNTTTGGPGFPTSPLALRTPSFGTQEAPTVKVLASADPTLIVQFPLSPASIKALFPNATGLVTVIQGNPQTNDFDTVIVDVQNLPPNQKFTVFFTELSAKPFGHAEYVGDVITRSDGTAGHQAGPEDIATAGLHLHGGDSTDHVTRPW